MLNPLLNSSTVWISNVVGQISELNALLGISSSLDHMVLRAMVPYFDANNVSVRYEFGFGLSYTTFGLFNAESARIGNGAGLMQTLIEPLVEP